MRRALWFNCSTWQNEWGVSVSWSRGVERYFARVSLAPACFEKVIDAVERAMDPFSPVKNQWWLGMPPSVEAR
jgi:hypothetical protein